MTTVRISDKLVGHVVEAVAVIYRKRLVDLENDKPNVASTIYDLIYGPYIERMNALPSGFLRSIDRFEINEVAGEKHSLTFVLSPGRPSAWAHPVNGIDFTPGPYSDKLNMHRTPQTEEMCNTILSWRKNIKDVLELRERSQKAVRKVLKQFVSLPPAIKMFPPLAELLPGAAKSKTDVPQHKLTSMAMELDPDLKQLAADIAVHKLLNR